MGSTRWVIQYALLAQSLCSVDRISSFTRSCVNISVSECLSRKWDHFVSRRISHTFAILFLFQCHCIVSFSFTMVNLPPGLPDLSVVQKPSTKKCCVHYGLLNRENMEDIAQQGFNIRRISPFWELQNTIRDGSMTDRRKIAKGTTEPDRYVL